MPINKDISKIRSLLLIGDKSALIRSIASANKEQILSVLPKLGIRRVLIRYQGAEYQRLWVNEISVFLDNGHKIDLCESPDSALGFTGSVDVFMVNSGKSGIIKRERSLAFSIGNFALDILEIYLPKSGGCDGEIVLNVQSSDISLTKQKTALKSSRKSNKKAITLSI